MPFVFNFPFFCILFTMVGGIISSVLKAKPAFYLNVFITSICSIMSILLLIYMYQFPQEVTYLMGHFPAPWGNEIRFGPFEVLMGVVLSVVMLLVIIGQKDRMFFNVKEKKINLAYLMMNLMLSSLYALTYTNDLFTAYVFIEINTLCACGLIMAKENGKTIGATIKYLLMSLLGSGLYLVAIILLYDLTGHLLMPNVGESLQGLIASGSYTLPITIIGGLLAVGIAIKSALFPFHTWMSHAYNNAMNMSNAISSGLVVKGYVILLIKFFYDVFGLEVIKALNVGDVLLLFATLGIIIGSIDALREKNVKRMLAYSSVGQMGYIYAGIGLATYEGLVAACFVIISHALTKSMLFCSLEGLMFSSSNSKYIDGLKGSAYRNPIAALGFTIGAFSMIGLPLFSGFIAKYTLSIAAISEGGYGYFILIALLISTVLNAIYFSRVLLSIFTRDSKNQKRHKNSLSYASSIAVFIVLNVLTGVFYQPIIEIILSGFIL